MESVQMNCKPQLTECEIAFRAKPDEANCEALYSCLRGSELWVAMIVVKSDLAYEVAETLRFRPSLYTCEAQQYFPIYSRKEEATGVDDEALVWMKIPFTDVLQMFNNMRDVVGMILDPYSYSLIFDKELANFVASYE